MEEKPRDKKHLMVGLLFILAGAFFVAAGLGIGMPENLYERKTFVIENRGEDFEGHSPIGFSGSGSGILLGDNLNEIFPNKDGIQSFLNFDLTKLKGEKIKSAVLYSEFAQIEGEPFESLGNVLVDEVSYGEFSSKVWNTESFGNVCVVNVLEDGIFTCDITEHIDRFLREGKETAQFRLRFEKVSDEDNQKDLLLFYKTDLNKNEKGIFKIRVNDAKDLAEPTSLDVKIVLPIVLHRVVESGDLNTVKTEEEILEAFKEVESIWGQANISFDAVIRDESLEESLLSEVRDGNYRNLYSVTVNEPLSLHAYFFSDVVKDKDIVTTPLLVVISDNEENVGRELAHGIGHLLSLVHTGESKDRLLFEGGKGEGFSDDEILVSREYAGKFKNEIESRNE
jgi:hypothetical protein